MPDGIEKVAGGYWVDGYEACRLRYTLERARLIMDTLNRREKYKRLSSRLEGEAFESKFWWLLDKAKGRKPRKITSSTATGPGVAGAGIDDAMDEEGGEGAADDDGSDGTLSETESETSDDDDFLNEIMGKPKKAYMPKKGADLTFVYGDRPEDLDKKKKKEVEKEEEAKSNMDIEGDTADVMAAAAFFVFLFLLFRRHGGRDNCRGEERARGGGDGRRGR